MVEASSAEHRDRQDRRAQLHIISILPCCLQLQGPAAAGLHNWPLEFCCTPLEREEKQGTALERCHRAAKQEKSGSTKHAGGWKHLGWEDGALAGLVEQQGTEQEAELVQASTWPPQLIPSDPLVPGLPAPLWRWACAIRIVG